MQTNHGSDTITVKITPNDRGNPAGKLADAELHFGGESPLAGLKLNRLQHLGASRRQRPERHVPGAVVRGERRAPELRAPATGRGHHGAERRA